MNFILSFFSSKGTLNRSQYLVRIICIFIINFIISFSLFILDFSEKQVIVTTILPTLILIYLNIEKRVKSIGWDPAMTFFWVFGSFVPFLNIILGLILLLKKGSKSDEDYNENESLSPEKVASWCFSLLIVSFLISLTIESKDSKNLPPKTLVQHIPTQERIKQEPQKSRGFSMINEQYEKEAKQRKHEDRTAKINELRKNFIYQKDDFENTGWYIHKNQKNLKNGIRVLLSEKNFLYIEASATTKRSLMFQKMSIKGNNGIFVTDESPELDANSVRVNYDFSYSEHKNFLLDGIKIARFINENINGDIKVRLHGYDSNYDFIIPNKDKKAISDAFNLKSLIDQTNE